MPKIHLLLRGPAAAPYPNGGDEAYWMGQVAGALASHLGQEGIPLEWGPPQEEDAMCLTLSSQAAPPELEGQKKGPVLVVRPGDALGWKAAAALAQQLRQVYPQPELVTLEEGPVPELEGLPGAGVALRLLYRDNPQDEAWLARNTGAAGKALAQGLSQAASPHA